ncbi:SNF2_N domain-containing protein/Helicase_C domain-containing protein/zf-CW domain-containing protein [Cephalotus follicularis]|uniref:SNF2_N domain-containing protein/Helicase_C domain-containing protein/zf-CW domain-containing protein n=1 Tax=Cephalotus follicularis TaxID=3775 RepID=A0A1Q3CJC2_CEPFO|nr:SNF2_N domain-containing protein/Helicase_C domain-containing protein/zf-CW domain-containing protein [Cephalotus follicularis]
MLIMDYPDHKLCGYLCAILAVPNLTETLPFATQCQLFNDGDKIGFKSQNGTVLSPITDENNKNAAVLAQSKMGRRMRKVGLVHGSVSVVQQLHALASHKSVKIDARVVFVQIASGKGNGNGDARVVLLVDVYLPIALWSGWQFPWSKAIAAALFRHLSCDWEERSSMLVDNRKYDNERIWNVSDCHVIGCKLGCGVPDSSRKRLFELHEIFKSLPSVTNTGDLYVSRVEPADDSNSSGIWDVPDDVLIKILTALGPVDLVRVAASCRHLRSLAASVMPCMKLKLFPHQQAAVEWMLQRERNAEVMPHPLYKVFSTEDGFSFCMNTVTGEIVTGIAPTIKDFRGGMFCDEPGLGKTITALSLILKTQGTIADPPDGVQVIWCMHNGDPKCGYYELNGVNITCNNMCLGNKVVNQNNRRRQISSDKFIPMDDFKYSSPKRARLMDSGKKFSGSNNSCPGKVMELPSTVCSEAWTPMVRCTRSLSRIRKNLLYAYDGDSGISEEKKVENKSTGRTFGLDGQRHVSWEKQADGIFNSCKKSGKATADYMVCNETWVQCDACRKWRKVVDTSVADATAAWFCSMNTDRGHQSCHDREEAWDNFESITYLPGFYTRGTSGGKEQNVSFFIGVLKEHHAVITSKTKKGLTWLATLSLDELSAMETIGLPSPYLGTYVDTYHKIFQTFGLTKRVEKGTTRWYYPRNLENLVFDVAALRIALCEPLDSFRLYLSRATLIVVPANLINHWKTQIQRHVRPGHLRLFVWTDHRRPSAHSLAWDYDLVITTFTRLSAEWGHHKKSALMQIHWFRAILDEGHTLGSSVNLTNKLQMAVSLTASNRWLLTGTPTPNTPNNQLSHLLPMLKFLHDEAYGLNQKSWEAGILRPFEAEMEEGRSRLLQLLHRCMISARKTDLKSIPPCIKKVTFLNFTQEHARTYNELVVTVRRNILMADWNDPSHVESLLNPKQWKFRSATIRNVRLSCCVAGHIKVTDAGEDIQETMDILVDSGLDPISEEYALIKYYLLFGGNCLRCNEWCRLPIITPCRHLLCLHCVALDSEKCALPGCGNLYEMQSSKILTRAENPNPKWPVPKDLIELQPSYKQDDWNPDWQSTSSSKVSYLVEKLKALLEANKEISYSMDEDNDTKQELLCPSQLSVQSCKALPEKVLIFSQFLEHIHVIEQQLIIAGIKFAGMYSPMHSSNKMKSLAMFQNDTSCMALLMDGSAALGLDLSFVTHVFLMEPIWDRSMEEQVISRAHRMGATRPIYVETLAMRGTIEEQMVEFLQDADECRRLLKEEFRNPDHEGARNHHRTLHDFAESNYLAQLSFVPINSKT